MTLVNQMIGAVDEGFNVLETLGYAVTPASQAQFIRNRGYLIYPLINMYALTPFTRLMDPMSQSDEMLALHSAFEALKKRAAILTPNWDALASYQPAAVLKKID